MKSRAEKFSALMRVTLIVTPIILGLVGLAFVVACIPGVYWELYPKLDHGNNLVEHVAFMGRIEHSLA